MDIDREQFCEGKSDFILREDKSLSLGLILKKEIDFQNEFVYTDGYEHCNIELIFEKSEKEKQIPDDYNFFI